MINYQEKKGGDKGERHIRETKKEHKNKNISTMCGKL